MTKTRNGRRWVVTLTVNVHLRVVSIAVELHIVSSNNISKVRHIEQSKNTKFNVTRHSFRSAKIL